MTDVPKIVHHRLRAATPEQHMLERAHPEADVLAAFAEQALSTAERDGVLQHLALCTDCRDVVALALPAMDLTVTPVEAESEAVRARLPDKARTNWFAGANLRWANLRWAALAAGIAVAVLVVRPGLEYLAKPNAPTTSVASQTAAPAGQTVSASQDTSELPAKMPMAEEAIEAKTGTARVKSGFSSNRLKAAFGGASGGIGGAPPLPQAMPGTLVAGNMKNGSASAGMPAAGAMFGARAGDAPTSANETVEVSGATTEVEVSGAATEVVPAPSASLMSRAETPAIEKAKPALDDMAATESDKTTATLPVTAQAQDTSQARGGRFALRAAAPPAMALKQNSSWMIATGVLQRSLDGGQSWQTAARADHALLCYANRGQEVWTGGQAGTLLHSTDGGTTWSAVAVSFKGQPLSSGVTHIVLGVRDPAEIVLATDNRETWISADSGKTWEKK